MSFSIPAPLPEPNLGALSGYHGPKGFHWLIRGWLAGMPRPGLLQAVESDLEALSRMGVGALVTLTEEWEPPKQCIEDSGIASLYAAIPDMCPPTTDQAIEICSRVAEFVANGQAVTFHCRAGRGRTGTLLAAQLIWHGADYQAAIEHAKRRNQLWIESESQFSFLREFFNLIAKKGTV